MKSLLAQIFRSDYDCKLNHCFGQKNAYLLHPAGPLKANEGDLILKIIDNPNGHRYGLVAIAVDINGDEIKKPGTFRMAGGTFVHCCDSRFSETFGSQPISIHDRFEPYSR